MAEAIAGKEEYSEAAPASVMDMSRDEEEANDVRASDESDESGADARDSGTDSSKSAYIEPALDVPKDFANRVATKITAINERELDEEIASSKVAALVYKNMSHPDALPYFNETIDILLQDEHTHKYAATTWTSLHWHEDVHPEYRKFVNAILDRTIMGHIRADLPMFDHEESGKEFSAYAYTLGETFIQMMRLSSDLYNILTDIYSYIIRNEMTRDLEKGKEESTKKKIIGRKKAKESEVKNPKKLFDDIVDYISERGEFRSDTLEQKNPNEFILILADQLRSTRRYIIQDIMNRHALERKKTLEKELRDRQASAEEVIQASEPFKHGLYLFWLEKRYNFKYLAVEKVRITLQIASIFLGLGAVGIGFLGVGPLGLLEGLMVGALMMIYSQLFCSRSVFGPFYPKDVTVELEKDVGAYTPTFRKMSINQMNSFMNRQLKEAENGLLLHLIPEYVKYIFAVMPDRTEILMTKENVNEFMERLEINLSKLQRSR
jgi:hypothetical protein